MRSHTVVVLSMQNLPDNLFSGLPNLWNNETRVRHITVIYAHWSAFHPFQAPDLCNFRTPFPSTHSKLLLFAAPLLRPALVQLSVAVNDSTLPSSITLAAAQQ